VVSNRGPVSFGRDEHGERIATRGGGGLASALRSLGGRDDVTWVASAMTDEDRSVSSEHGGSFEASGYRLRLVVHEPSAYERFYTVAANPTLWFVHHALPGADLGPRFLDAWRNGYVPVNEGLAAAVVEELERTPGTAVFIHDYHLYLAPRLIRDRRPDVRTSHFIHIPWPEPDAWAVLPEAVRLEIIDGLLANDVVGFHTERWRRNFVATLGGDCPIRVTAHPIGIDPDEFDRLRRDADVLERERELVANRPELLVLRVDRTDPAKNVIRGFEALALMLERHPELNGRVRMLALLDPSRLDIPQYADYRDEIEREANAVEARFPGSVHLRIADDFVQSVAAYKQYDVLLVNGVYDGLNLVSKEAPYLNERDGVLVLSENTGSVEELGSWALTVDPFDVSDQADALYAAITMPPPERRRRAESIRGYVGAHDQSAWIAAQLKDLEGP
jgi:trehalose 6-phosphate synthase